MKKSKKITFPMGKARLTISFAIAQDDINNRKINTALIL